MQAFRSAFVGAPSPPPQSDLASFLTLCRLTKWYLFACYACGCLVKTLTCHDYMTHRDFNRTFLELDASTSQNGFVNRTNPSVSVVTWLHLSSAHDTWWMMHCWNIKAWYCTWHSFSPQPASLTTHGFSRIDLATLRTGTQTGAHAPPKRLDFNRMESYLSQCMP